MIHLHNADKIAAGAERAVFLLYSFFVVSESRFAFLLTFVPLFTLPAAVSRLLLLT